MIYLGITKQFPEEPILTLVIQGAVLIVVVRFAPRGLWPLACNLVRRVSPGFRGGTQRQRERPVDDLGEGNEFAEDDATTPDVSGAAGRP